MVDFKAVKANIETVSLGQSRRSDYKERISLDLLFKFSDEDKVMR